MKKKTLLLATLVLVVFSGKSQSGKWTLYDTTNSGIPDNEIEALAIDDNGDKWVGTEWGGVAKYDGNDWTVYDTSNTALLDNSIYSIALDQDGNKWFGTGYGLAKFNGTDWTVYTDTNSNLPYFFIRSVTVASNGDLWVSTNSGIAKYDGNGFTTYTYSNSGFPDSSDATSIAIDGNGDLWIGTKKEGFGEFGGAGLVKFDGQNNWEVYNDSNSDLPSNMIYSVAIEGSSEIWAGTYYSGMAKFDGGSSWMVYEESGSDLPEDDIRAITIDSDGNKWIGTRGRDDGMAKFDGQSDWTIYNRSNTGMPVNRVQSLSEDVNGNMWIGTLDSGLVVLNEDASSIEESPVRKSNIDLYPNPAREHVNIEGPAEMVIVFNQVGAVVKKEEVFKQKATMDISDLPKGNYILKIETADTVETRNLIKH